MGALTGLERKVTIQHPTTTKTAMGAPTRSWVLYCYCYVSRTQVSDVPEQYVNNRLVTPTRYKYKMHYQAGIDETMRIVDGSETFNILSVNQPDRLFLELLAEKVTE